MNKLQDIGATVTYQRAFVRVGDHDPEPTTNRIHSSDGGVESRHATPEISSVEFRGKKSSDAPLGSRASAAEATALPSRAGVATGPSEVPEPSDAETPTFYTGTWFLVDEIDLGLSVLTAKVRALKEGNHHRAAVTQKLAAEEISKVAGQIKSMADTLTRVTIEHVNRKSHP